MARRLRFDADGRLVEQRERNLGVNVPVPVSERVDSLAELLYAEGHGPVARKELVAALILAASTEPARLAEHLSSYRRARVRDALVGQPPSGNVISFAVRAPGPRARSK
jgi:hypothetical protein